MRSLPLPALIALAACGGDAAAGALATRADSAGIEIVTNAAPAWPAGTGWRIEPAPVLEIGPRPDNDPHYDLLRASAGAVLPSGEIALLVAGSREIRFFSPQGEWLRSAGREGDGPGEMRVPAGLAVAGDTVFIRDVSLSRLSAFHTDGRFLASWPFPSVGEGGRVIPSFRLADGSWIGSAGISFGGTDLPASGLSRRPVGYYRLAADLSAMLDTVVETPGSEQVVNVMTADGGAIRGISVYTPPLGRSAPVVAGGDLLLWGDNARPEFRLHAPDGTLRALVRWTAPAVPVDAALIGRMKQAALDRSDGTDRARERIETQYAIPSPAPVVPWFGGIHLDGDRAIWIREYPVLQSDSVRFRIFQTDGQLLGQLTLGPRHTVLEIGPEHLLTVWQDDDDLEYLRVYRLHRDGER